MCSVCVCAYSELYIFPKSDRNMEWRSYTYLQFTVLSRCTYGTFIGSVFAVVKVEGLFIKISFDNNIYSNTYSSAALHTFQRSSIY